jgi:hypothetical protein
MHRTTVIPLADVCRDARIWPRLQLCRALVKELEEIYLHGSAAAVEPIVVARIGRTGRHVLIDGWHRVAAAELAGLTHLPVTIVELASEEEAYERALQLSSRGKTPMTRVEKQTAVDRLLTAHPERSDLAVAQLAGVSNHLVAARRRLLAAPPAPQEDRERRPRPDKYTRSIMKATLALCALGEAGDEGRLEDALASAAVRECGKEAGCCLGRLRVWAEGARSRVLLVGAGALPSEPDETADDGDEGLPTPAAGARGWSDVETTGVGGRTPYPLDSATSAASGG